MQIIWTHVQNTLQEAFMIISNGSVETWSI